MNDQVTKLSDARTRRLEALKALLDTLIHARETTGNPHLRDLVGVAEARAVEQVARTLDAEGA